jgi:hypothetical protein
LKATIVSTDRIVDSVPAPGGPRSVPARVWEGVTEGGVKFIAYITAVQVAKGESNLVFERELTEHKRPTPFTERAIDMRHIL